ncbi:hypothetical protein BpHYR1_031580 [Brachionus plicatilis]|uniref:Uncharacterized protein n=1 Tax=Brachionus plicatilis TaxID=10195 RepID=A0A3M7QC12_BRAPC|nr:hypothetical protein BpHYR1_031580 [Brachionus plicatilis]
MCNTIKLLYNMSYKLDVALYKILKSVFIRIHIFFKIYGSYVITSRSLVGLWKIKNCDFFTTLRTNEIVYPIPCINAKNYLTKHTFN